MLEKRKVDMTAAERLVQVLTEKEMTCATAGSSTGGGVGSAITAVAGSSAVFWCGVLGVPEEVLATKGAVSPECGFSSRRRNGRTV